jgi:hypothetical protein
VVGVDLVKLRSGRHIDCCDEEEEDDEDDEEEDDDDDDDDEEFLSLIWREIYWLYIHKRDPC